MHKLEIQENSKPQLSMADHAERSSVNGPASEEHAVLDEIIDRCKAKRRELRQRPKKLRTATWIHHVGVFEVRRTIEAMPHKKVNLSHLRRIAKREINGIDRCEGNVVSTLDDLIGLCEAKQSQLR